MRPDRESQTGRSCLMEVSRRPLVEGHLGMVPIVVCPVPPSLGSHPRFVRTTGSYVVPLESRSTEHGTLVAQQL